LCLALIGLMMWATIHLCALLPRRHHREFVLVSDLLGSVTPSGDPLKQILSLLLFVVMIIVNT
jgi:hypothetical protein